VRLALIAAVARNGVIGDRNALPWRLPEDLRHFRALTTGHTVIMGRKTWESLRHPLPARQNIVVSSQRGFSAPGAEVAPTLAQALERSTLPPPAFCIGGGELYRAALPKADVVHITAINRDFDGDTRFPPLDQDEWMETERLAARQEGPAGLEYAFVTYRRRDPR
jgi:dihydrofolate reductase